MTSPSPEDLIARARQRAASGLGFASQATADLIIELADTLEALSRPSPSPSTTTWSG
jgi:hypothetical protein